jgi:hypothetical protein
LSPKKLRVHYAEYILLAVMVALLGAGLGRLYAFFREYLYPWLTR